MFGFDFIADTLRNITPKLADNLPHDKRLVITPNVEQVVKYKKLRKTYPEFVTAILSRAIVLPDGMPIIWMSRLLGRDLPERLAGSDIFPGLIEELDSRQRKMYLVGATEDVLQAIVNRATHKELFKTYAPPYFQIGERSEVVERLVTDIETFSPHCVFLGLSFPKPEILSTDVLNRLEEKKMDAPLFLCVGAALEFFAGTKKRAPVWLQKVGLEWLFRLCREPKRLGWRYLATNVLFLGVIWEEIASSMRMHRATSRS
ncbi:MAG: WecB/TagA/CpsF family glycosyltransferase [Candidatus Abyssubacteria bacterium]